MKRKILIALALLVAAFLVTLTVHHQRETRRQKEIVNFFGIMPPAEHKETVARQLEIALHPRETINPDYVPVHIVRRKDQSEPWLFIGTGTLLTKKPGAMITASHVIESATPMQYGYRLVGEEEWAGTAKVKPITGALNITGIGDSLVCTISEGDLFPPLNVTPQFAGKTGIDAGTRVPMDICLPGVVVRLLTEPSRRIPCLCTTKRADGVFVYIFDFDPQPGESGSGAILEYKGEQKFMVVTHHHKMNGHVLVTLGLASDIYQTRQLGVGHGLDITYGTPPEPDKNQP